MRQLAGVGIHGFVRHGGESTENRSDLLSWAASSRRIGASSNRSTSEVSWIVRAARRFSLMPRLVGADQLTAGFAARGDSMRRLLPACSFPALGLIVVPLLAGSAAAQEGLEVRQVPVQVGEDEGHAPRAEAAEALLGVDGVVEVMSVA